MSVGQRINERMKARKMSQNKLAKVAQISQSGLSSIISGAVSPKEVTLSAIAAALECSVSELMGETAPGVIPIRKWISTLVGGGWVTPIRK